MQQGGVLGTLVRNEFDAKVRMMCKVTSALPIGEMELIRNIDALSIVCMGVQCMLRSNGGAGTNQVISFIRNHPSITQSKSNAIYYRQDHLTIYLLRNCMYGSLCVRQLRHSHRDVPEYLCRIGYI